MTMHTRQWLSAHNDRRRSPVNFEGLLINDFEGKLMRNEVLGWICTSNCNVLKTVGYLKLKLRVRVGRNYALTSQGQCGYDSDDADISGKLWRTSKETIQWKKVLGWVYISNGNILKIGGQNINEKFMELRSVAEPRFFGWSRSPFTIWAGAGADFLGRLRLLFLASEK